MTGPTMSQDPPAASSIAGRHGLIRPKEQRQVAGVCIGVARATGTDPMLWRVLVAVGVLFGGVGLVAYLLGWLIMPEEDDTGSPLEALLGRGRSSTSGIVTVILAVATALLLVITVEWTPITLVVLAVVGFVMYRQRKPDSPWPPAGTPPTGPFPGPPQGPMPGPPQGPHPDPAPQGPPPGPFPPRAAGPALGPPPGPFPPSGPSQRPSVPQVPPPDEPRAGSATVPHSMSRQDAVTVPVPPESAATMPADAAPEPAAGAPDGAPTAPGDTTGAGGTGQTAEGSQHAGDPNRDTGENPEPLTEQSYVSDLASGAPVEPIIDQEPGPEASTEPDSAEDPAAGTRSAEDLATEQVTGAVSEQPTVPLAISGVPPQVPVPGHGPAGSHPPGPATDDTELLALAARYRDGTAAPPQWSPPPTPSLPPTPSTPPTPSPPPAPRPRRSRLGRVALFAMLIAIGLVAVLHLSGAPLGVGAYLAAVLAVTGAALLVGAWYGRARWLIALGMLLSLALAVTAGVERADVTPDGDVSWRPATVEEINDRYKINFGNGVLDLRDVDFTDRDVTIDLKVDGASLTVLLPPDVDVTGETKVAYSNAVLIGDEVSATTEIEHSFSDTGLDNVAGPGALRVDAKVNLGNLEIVR